MHKNLLVDVNNVMWKVRHVQKLNTTKKEPFVPQLLFLLFIEDINACFKKFKADGVLCAFEGRSNWRKKVYAEYKNKDDSGDIYYEDVQEAIVMVKDFLDTYTSIKTADTHHLEADDIIAVACQEKSVDVQNTIISSDRDFVQLLLHENVRLFSPQQDKFRESDDPQFDLFLKCIRGDKSDNIFSAYPRVKTTVLEEAFHADSMSMINLMKHKLADGSLVGDNYKQNKKLIDLTLQPANLREKALNELKVPVTGKYHQGKVMKFAKEHEVMKMIENTLTGAYTKLFNSNFRL